MARDGYLWSGPPLQKLSTFAVLLSLLFDVVLTAGVQTWCTDGSGNVPYGTPCSFPFTFNDQIYTDSCVDNVLFKWCYTGVGGDTSSWGNCKDCSADLCAPFSNSCLNCTTQDYCDWCPSTKQCIPGSGTGPFQTTCPDFRHKIGPACDKLCNLPASIPVGYQIDTAGCLNGTAASECKMKCAPGFAGTLTVTCAWMDGTFEFGGCVPVNTNTQTCTIYGNVQYNTTCYLPFRYQDVVYNSCTMVGDSKEWCATSGDYDGNYGYCRPCSSDPCVQYGASCATCTQQTTDDCVWCEGTKKCIPGSSSGPFLDSTNTCGAYSYSSSSCPIPDPCPDLTSCETCSDSYFASQGCAWCPSSSSCKRTTSATCSGGFLTGACPVYDPCSVYDNWCLNCTDAAGGLHCGYCGATRKCLTGYSSGPDLGSCVGTWMYSLSECSEYCNLAKTCSDCTSSGYPSAGCGWCAATSTCAKTATAACAAGFLTECPYVDPCLPYNNDCQNCSAQAGCGFCETTQTCQSGDSVKPNVGQCTIWKYTSDQCANYDYCPLYTSGGCGTCMTDGSARGCAWCPTARACLRTSTNVCTGGFYIGNSTNCPDPCLYYTKCNPCASDSSCAWCNKTASCNTWLGTLDILCGIESMPSTSQCPPFKCNKPTILPAGYVMGPAGCSDGSTAVACNMTCGIGYVGTPVASCDNDGETFQFTGCSLDPCLPYTGCGNCTGQAACGWCETSKTCYTGTPKGAVSGASCPIWLWEQTECGLSNYCSYFPNCQYCNDPTFTSYGCTWCPKAIACLKSNATCLGTGFYTGPPSTCPDPCAIETDCFNCTARSQCAWCNSTSVCNTYRSTQDLSCAVSFISPYCPLPSRCDKPAVIPAGYVATGCPNNSTGANCLLSCAAGYHGLPVAWCPMNNGSFVFSGCTLNLCTLPLALPSEYSYSSGCLGSNTVHSCGGISCAYGYNGVVSTTCAANGGAFLFSGCIENVCTLPSLSSGFVTTSCAGVLATRNCAIRCAAHFVGSPTAVCETPGTFTIYGDCKAICSGHTCEMFYALKEDPQNIICPITGCDTETCCEDTRKCSKPSVLPPGYVVGFMGCVDGSLARNCFIRCDSGYLGSAMPSCPVADGTFSFAGCTLDVRICNKPAFIPIGYTINPAGCPNNSLATSCSVRCSNGFVGAARALCSLNGSIFTFTGCSSTVPMDFRGFSDFYLYDINSQSVGYAAFYSKGDKLMVMVTNTKLNYSIARIEVQCDSTGANSGPAAANQTCIDIPVQDAKMGCPWWQSFTLTPAIFQQLVMGNSFLVITYYPSMPTAQTRIPIAAFLGNPIPNFYAPLIEQPQQCTKGGGLPPLAPNNSVCSFPFEYLQKVYTGCTTVDNDGVPWCATYAGGNGWTWGNCTNCARTGDFGYIFLWFHDSRAFGTVHYYSTLPLADINFQSSGIFPYPFAPTTALPAIGLAGGSLLKSLKDELQEERMLAVIVNNDNRRLIVSQLTNWEVEIHDGDPIVNLTAQLDFFDRGYDDATLTVAFNLPNRTVGNEIWVHFPKAYDISNASVIAVIGILAPHSSVDFDYQNNIAKVKWTKPIVPYANYSVSYLAIGPAVPPPWLVTITFAHLGSPNNCDNVTFTVTTHECFDENLFGAGIYFVHRCVANASDISISAVTPYGRPWGCSICNSCQYTYRSLNGDDVFVCEENQKVFTRVNVLQKPGCNLPILPP